MNKQGTMNRLRRARVGVAAAAATTLAAVMGTGAALARGGGQAPAAASQARMFPFVIPWDDPSPTLVDVSGLNTRPAGTNGFIVVKNGHFAEEKTGRRVRFVGVNMTFASAFPARAEAEKIAARLAKYGVNVVRIHYIDASGYGPATIWDPRAKNFRRLDPAQMDRFDYFVAQLKKQGVYVNLNLKVARTFTPEDGLPASVKQIPFTFSKRVDQFDRRMIALQKEHARNLLTHVNPYTGRAYNREPAVLCVEINNENSLLGDPWETLGGKLADLPEPFAGDLRARWNRWLAAKYRTPGDVSRAWQGGNAANPSTARELLRPAADPANWSREQVAPAVFTVSPARNDAAALRLDVPTAGAADWHAQLTQAGLTLEEGKPYTLTFRARSLGNIGNRPRPRSVGIAVSLDQPDWRNLGLNTTVRPPTTGWQTFRLTFEARNVVPGHARLAFALGSEAGGVLLSDVSLKAGAPGATLAPGQSPQAGNVPLARDPVGAHRADWLLFLAETERAYAREMRDFLKRDLQIRVPIVDSQVTWGGMAGVYREGTLFDYVDNHAYWDHPQTPVTGWDPVGARLNNTSMIPSLGSGDTLTDLARHRVAGKPYVVSEYNHPAPNDFQAETVPLLASFAAWQDWDAVYLHEYGTFGRDNARDNDRIAAYFVIGSNPAKWAFLPTAARLFRAGLVGPAPGGLSRLLPAQLDGALVGKSVASLWTADTRLGPADPFRQPLALVLSKPANPPANPTATVLNVTNRGDNKRAAYSVDAPGAKIVAGFVGGQTVTLGGGSFTFAANTTANNFAVLTLAALDDKPLASSSKFLLTLAARVENTGQTWRPDRHALTNWGTGPTLAEGVDATVTLQTDGARKVFALDSAGKPKRELPAIYAHGKLTFRAQPSEQTLWYAVVK